MLYSLLPICCVIFCVPVGVNCTLAESADTVDGMDGFVVMNVPVNMKL